MLEQKFEATGLIESPCVLIPYVLLGSQSLLWIELCAGPTEVS